MTPQTGHAESGSANLSSPSGAWRWGVLAAVLVAGIGLRLYDLEADPPLGMTWSHAPYTDGARIVDAARAKVLWGQWEIDPQGSTVMYYPLSSLLAYVVFTIFGIGLWQANLTGVIPGIAALGLILWLGLRKNWWVGVGAVLFAGISFYSVVYNRLPMSESLMIVLMLAVPVVLFREPLRWWHPAAAGLLLAAAGFFVKFHALVLLPVCLAWLVLCREEADSEGARRRWRNAGLFLGGLGVGAVAWLAVVLLPRPEALGDFLEHNLISQYGKGKPEGAGFAAAFFRERLMGVVGMGTNVTFFGRMPVVGLLAFLGALVYASDWRRRRGRTHWVESFAGLWFLGGIVALAMLDYRPLRYHLQLIPPMTLLAALALARLLESPPAAQSEAPPRTLTPWVFVFGTVIAFQLCVELPMYMARHRAGSETFLSALGLDPRSVFMGLSRFVGSKGTVLLVSALISAAVAGFVRWVRSRPKNPARSPVSPAAARVALAACLVGLCLLIDGGLYRGSRAKVRHSLRDTSLDLGSVVGPGGFVVGTTATTLTLNNQLKSLPAYGWIAKREDVDRFRTYPITHVLLREGVLNDFLQTHFSDVLQQAVFVRRYVIGPAESSLYRVNGWPGTERYEPTAYERGMEQSAREDWEEAAREFRAFLELRPGHGAATLALGQCLENLGQAENGARLIERVAALAPEDLALLTDLGIAYARQGRVTEAFGIWRRVLALNPYDARARNYTQLLRQNLEGGGARPRSQTNE